MVKNLTQKSLLQHGYKPVATKLSGVSAFLGITDHGTHMIALCDRELSATITGWQLMNMRYDLIWTFSVNEVFFVLFADDAGLTQAMLAEDKNHWVYDNLSPGLIVGEQAPTDFYGLRGIIAEAERQVRARVISEARPRASVRDRILTMTNLMVLLNVLVYLLGIWIEERTGVDYLEEWGALYTKLGTDAQIYRFATNMFLHADFTHIAGNMVALIFLGRNLETVIGKGKFLVIYLVGGLLASLVAYSYYRVAFEGPVSLVGASGAIFAVIGGYLYVLIRNWRRISRSTLPRFLIYIALTVYMGVTTEGVSLSAHLGGLGAGFVLAVLLYRKGKANQ